MRKDIEKYELIERYLKKELTQEELETVSKQIENDPVFAEEVKQHQSIFNFVIDGSMLDLKNKIKDIHDNSKINKTYNHLKNRRLLYYIAGLIIVSSAVFIGTLRKEKYVLKENNNSLMSDSIKEVDTIKIQTPVEKISNETKESVNQPSQKKEIQYTENKEVIVNANQNINETTRESNKPTELVNEVLNPIKTTNVETVNNTIIQVNSVKNVSDTSLKVSINCSETQISASVNVENSCEHIATGKIIIDKNSIAGGEPPYLISIDNKMNFYMLYQFDRLTQNTYSVWVQDKNNCLISLGTYLINPVECGYEFIFAPDKKERWKIPNEGNVGEISIFNQNGNLVYKSDLEEGITYYWDGTSVSGKPIPMGIYSFIITLQHGSSSYGSVTIVR